MAFFRIPLGVSPTKGFCWLRKKTNIHGPEALDVRDQLGSFHLGCGEVVNLWILFLPWWQEVYTTDLFLLGVEKNYHLLQKKRYLFWYLFPQKKSV